MKRSWFIGALILAGLMLNAYPVQAQWEACGDCVRKRPGLLMPYQARCCWYGESHEEGDRCPYLADPERGWTIFARGYIRCWTFTRDAMNGQDCDGEPCGGGVADPCENGGCTPGYSREPVWCQSENTIDECGCCYEYSPIVISLRGGGYHFSSARDGVMFDVNGLGMVPWIAWPTDADDAWLALDRNANGAIDNGGELFGNATRLRTGKAAANGYEALAEYDENADGLIDNRDSIYATLRLWTDVNRDGRSQPSELHSLRSRRVAPVGTVYRLSKKQDQYGNQFRLRSKVMFDNGASRFSYDVYPVAAPISGLTPVALGHCPVAATQKPIAEVSQR